MEMGESPAVAAERGGTEVSMAVLAATFTTSIVFFPVTFFSGISKYIFTPLAMGVVFSIFASYFFAMTVVPLYCAKFIHLHHKGEVLKQSKRGIFARFEKTFNDKYDRMLNWYERLAKRAMGRPGLTAAAILAGVVIVLAVTSPFLGRAYFPRTDPGQFVINVRMPSGTRLEVSNDYIAKVESVIRGVVKPADLDMIVSNIGVYPDLSAIYTTNASMDTAFVQVSLKENHSIGSYEYMQDVREKLAREMPELTTYFQAGGLVDSVVNQGLPAPIDIQVSSMDMEGSYALAKTLAQKIKTMPNVSGVYIPQDLDYPGIALNIDREKASLIGLSAKDVVDNVVTAMTSDGMVAPSYWIDPKSGNNYMVTVQYANKFLNNMSMESFREYSSARCSAIRLRPDAAGSRGDPRGIEGRSHRGLYAFEFGCGPQANQYTDGSGSLSDPPRNRHLCFDQNRGIARGRKGRQQVASEYQDRQEYSAESTWGRGQHEPFLC